MALQFRTITAKYPGICRRCNGPIAIGDRMRYGGPRQTWHLKDACPAITGNQISDQDAAGDLGDVPQAQPAAQRSDRSQDGPRPAAPWQVPGWNDWKNLPGILRETQAQPAGDLGQLTAQIMTPLESSADAAEEWAIDARMAAAGIAPAGDDFGF